jgi:hypothetical protein
MTINIRHFIILVLLIVLLMASLPRAIGWLGENGSRAVARLRGYTCSCRFFHF